MHGHTRWVSRERPDFARSAPERCWIDGDLIRLSQFPLGGIRPGVRGKPVSWLMDLAVLEEAMQEVYGRGFRLGDRAPLLQLAADALADGDRQRAVEVADAVAFPAPEFKSRFRDAGLRYLAWGPAHRRGNPRIDVDAWLARTSVERKYDADQPRVPRGHPDGGQWTDDSYSGGASENPGDEPLTEAEQELFGQWAEQARRYLAEAGDPDALRVLASGGTKLPKPGTKSRALVIMSEIIGQMTVYAVRYGPAAELAVDLWVVAQELLPQIVTFVLPPKTWEELVTDRIYHEFEDMAAFEDFYGKAGELYDWHHIVERNSGFSEPELHNTDNVVRIPRGKHWLVTSYMTQGRDDYGGLSYRQLLRGQPIEEHRRIGMEALKWAGALTE